MRIQNTYRIEQTEKFKEDQRNKERFLVKHGFDTNIKKLDITKKLYIPNYVICSEGESVFKHKFRDASSDKWISKKGFKYENSHDLLLNL